MPRFPGMNPFVEGQVWPDFHLRLNSVMGELLGPLLPERYAALLERRLYVEHELSQEDQSRIADIVVTTGSPAGSRKSASSIAGGVEGNGGSIAVECELPPSLEQRETYLVIRERASMEVVTVIETLSPSNKHVGGDGYRIYLQKRQEVLDSQTHLVELDLLRAGRRLPMASPLPPADYYAIISRGYRRPRASVFAWTLRDPLPTIPVPLIRGDDDVMLDMQEAITLVYQRALYDRVIRYDTQPDPPLTDSEAAWTRSLSG